MVSESFSGRRHGTQPRTLTGPRPLGNRHEKEKLSKFEIVLLLLLLCLFLLFQVCSTQCHNKILTFMMLKGGLSGVILAMEYPKPCKSM